ncbi:PAS domain-containing protein [Alteromonas sp. CYL-A6]|uniref:PAS domain-containing protein n=1 Tax=Alteromonas nitratireducens TaxID=3390813 RepID=UPI0034AEFC34
MPASAWAITDQVQALPAATFMIVFYGLCGIAGLFIILFIAKTLSAKRNIRKLANQQADQARLQAQMDSLSTGVILYDEDRQIVYANRTAAYLLGKKQEMLPGQPITSTLPDAIETALTAALDGAREQTLECRLPSRDRHYRLRVLPKMPELTGCAGQVILEDIDGFIHALDNADALRQHLSQLWDSPRTGLIRINGGDGSVAINSTLSDWVSAQASSLESLPDLFIDADRIAVEQLVRQALEGNDNRIDATLNGKKKPIPVTLSAHLAAHTAESEPLVHVAVVSRLQETEHATEASRHQKRFQSLTGMLPHAWYVLDADLKIKDCNRHFSAVFATDPMRVKGKPVTEVSCFNDAIKNLHLNLETSMPKQQVVTLNVGDDIEKTVRMNLQALYEEGERTGMLVIAEDLTPQVTLEKERDHAVSRLASFIDRAPMGVVVFDGDDVIKEVNHTVTRQLGLSADDLQNRTFYDLFSQPDQAGRAAKKLHRHDQFAELPASLKGSAKPVSATLYASKISEIPQEFVCWIGGREEQDYLNNRFERLIKYASVPVGILEDDGFTHLNSAACAFFGLRDEDELLGKSPDHMQLNGSQDNCNTLTEKLNTARAQGQVQTFTWQHTLRGEQLPCELTLIPVLRNGELQSIICIWVDLRAVEQANAARMEAIQLREAAEREVEEKQQLLATSQSKLEQQSATLAKTEETLATTEQKLSEAEEDLSAKMDTIYDLQQAHKDITAHLASLQDDYARNKSLLAQSQKVNAELESQLEQSSAKVGRLEKQRNQIADALQYSEKQYRQAQAQLDESKKETERLKQARDQQQQEAQQYLSQISELKNSIGEKDKQLSDVSGQIKTLQSQLTSSSEASDKLREQLINQRKASEEAQRQKREIELACQAAEAELAAKARNIEHLQHEMQMLEKMSQQEKGDMEAYAKQLQQELEAKQSQLSDTESALAEIRAQAEKDKQEKEHQQSVLNQLQQEMQEAEAKAKAQQEEMARIDAERREEQARLQEALQAKQQQLSDTARNLEAAIRQNEEAAAEKARQQSILERLQQEMQSAREEAEANQQKLAQISEERRQEHARLQEDLQAKQKQLQETEHFLQDAKQQTESEKAEKARQQAIFEKLKSELATMEAKSAEQQKAIEEADRARQAEQDALERELAARQKQLEETRHELESRQQQMDAEKQARQEQQALLEKLQSEMATMEKRAQEQQQAMSASDKQRAEEQSRLANELEAKQQQLEDARKELEARQKQMEDERLARQEQQAMLEQLKSELSDVAQRAAKQKEMMSGSDEQWRKHHEEIEAQKKQLQEALKQAQTQNTSMQSQLEQSKQALTQAESKVSQTQSEEQKLQAELNAAREQADELKQRLAQQEEQESKLQSQVKAQQNALKAREQSISDLESKQKALAEKLAAVEKEYAQTKASLSQQDNSQTELNEQLKKLENELNQSKSQLDSKEKALQQAQSKLKDSESRLAEQEQALVDAQKAEIQKENASETPDRPVPEFAKLPLPADANVWFDLLPYLQKNEQVGSLAQSLTLLMDSLSSAIDEIDEAVAADSNGRILTGSKKLVRIIKTLPSEPLNDTAARIQADYESNNFDNISIFWPIAKQNLLKTLRVIYSHLHD